MYFAASGIWDEEKKSSLVLGISTHAEIGLLIVFFYSTGEIDRDIYSRTLQFTERHLKSPLLLTTPLRRNHGNSLSCQFTGKEVRFRDGK